MRITKQPFVNIVLILVLGIAALSHGCALTHPQPETIRYYTLHYDAPGDHPACRSHAADKRLIVQVKRFHAPPPYNATHILYAESPHQRSSYAYHQWVSTPADMLTELLHRDMEHTGIADAVVSISSGHTVTHRVEGTIIDFYENDVPENWEAVLALRLMLVRTDRELRTETILFKRTYREVETLEKNNPLSLARSMSKAMEAVSVRFIEDVCRELE